ncbi:Redox-sensing transcriptional repressor Rex [Candidatus Hydrogenisulfobacillus filiaventi]|uniref:Redox-sensing transcriptional repressor Rex n=1 Tax=Candidatus Hydrogenisulfobacillus filiaventi TaxID=2707344 RepID=A0A6F8ZIB1_9FIRM|nr:redox-sensing transcriptional repressor Rex [Bacillota bacterium]CAB1129328.1 Redox-sensing transcriptional repressor Rex [Candidatus Hydrogenisulfobacillus filiaventi]
MSQVPSPGARRIPDATIRRLPAYLRALERSSLSRMTSGELGQLTGFSSEQVRKDLAYFGAFGTRGVGYEVPALAREIRRILGLDREVLAVLVGAGHLGTALLRYSQFSSQDVQVAAAFDVDPRVVGTTIGRVVVEPLEHLEERVQELGARIGIVAVPAGAANAVGERLTRAGVRAILNFAPVTICQACPEVVVHNIDLALELQALAYFVTVTPDKSLAVERDL